MNPPTNPEEGNKSYVIEYDLLQVACVEIDHVTADENIREMADFFSGGEYRLKATNGNYTSAFLKQLGNFILTHSRLPINDEGWYPMDGSAGIIVTNFTPWEFDEEEIFIDERQR